MFSINHIVLTNFRSYYGTHVFKLPTESGLFFLTGKNLINPELGSNGAGKSTLLDSLMWVLYGRTTRGLKASDVVAHNQKGCSVTLTITVGDKRAVVRRTQNPNSLTLTDDERTSDRPIDQQALDNFLRLSPESFLYSVILPQFGSAFFDLTPTAKLTLFSTILGLDYWLDRSQAAKDHADDIEAQRIKQEMALSKAEGQCEGLEADLTELLAKEIGFGNARIQEVKEIKAKIQQITEEKVSVQSEISDFQNALLRAEEKIAKLVTKSICPACKQNIPNADLTALRRNQADFEGKLHRLGAKTVVLTERQSQLLADIKKEPKNPYSEMIAEKGQALVKAEEQKSLSIVKINKLNEEHTAVSYWVGGFKRVRLFIVEETLRQLELKVNNNLASLGLMEWRIAFDVERENKSGGVTKGFTVMIYPPGAEDPIRYEAYSGGETQRLRLAGDLGLANLIMERAGLSNTIEFFDEPSQHLSQEGLLDLAETLCHRASEQGKRILLVDHSIIDFSGFAGTICILKDAEGSRITSHDA